MGLGDRHSTCEQVEMYYGSGTLDSIANGQWMLLVHSPDCSTYLHVMTVWSCMLCMHSPDGNTFLG